MRSRDFIKTFKDQAAPTKERVCSRLLQGTDGNFYSFGYHYPLLFKIPGTTLWCANVAGYSVTTSKHISFARQCADISLILDGSSIPGIKDALKILNAMHERKFSEFKAARIGTKKQAMLLNEVNGIVEDIKKVRSFL